MKTDIIYSIEKLTDGEVGYLITKREVNAHTRKDSGSPDSKRKRQTDTLKAQINKLRVSTFS